MLNNAFRNLSRTATATPLSSRRWMATNIYEKAVRADKDNNVRKKMLSDPSTYPIIVILSAAVTACVGFGIFHLRNAPDVQLNPTRRSQLFRDWSRARGE
mmetsp:Transcript_8412/g.15874  ORF Transcript_8412/g.15874 Transcript_8412/m.15874 type:complete len:100 (+) Transcript_8412:244-543(+)|eukprot:CAMPEP_0176491776 /NCGR_PEP_ID=MMETSP0200_2-20121128/8617_1 /TAXON_ID=947934 /ORGANISM="Chaetoceros sp., Strain GSL56" /LENGTH=99 /DNA_ID=CAMNT_0017889237 /DNA_START=211 /DNA_END=510 /DNA_ORIENTATION=+